MPGCCAPDPRDALASADDALRGLLALLHQQAPGESVEPRDLAALLGIIHDRMRPAVEAVQAYDPRD